MRQIHPIRRHNYSFLLIIVSMCLSLLVASSAKAEFTVAVDFNKYPNDTPVSAFQEPHMTFASNGLGLARAWGGSLQVYGGSTNLTIDFSAPVSGIRFNYDVAGTCAFNVTLQLFKNGQEVDVTRIGICTGDAIFQRSLEFDRFVLTLPGPVMTVQGTWIWNFEVTFAEQPAAGVSVFSGPPLPEPGARNLMLALADTALLTEPGGASTGRVLRACQTVFVIEVSKDGTYGRVYSFGNSKSWLALADMMDIAEDYGQKDSPIYPPCVGK